MMSYPAQAAPVRREIELDFIRGVAILLVLDYHSPYPLLLKPLLLLGWSHFGWAGVDIFFVLSGFLIGGLLVKEQTLRGKIDTKRFLVRRGFKIWPQYYFFLLAILITGHHSLHALWGNLLNIQNYVGGVAHTWTLAVEEQAYIVLVFALAFATRRAVSMKAIFFSLAAASCSILLWRFVLAAHGVNVYTRTDTRVDGIFYGVMLAILYHRAPPLFRRIQSMNWLWAGVLVLTLALFRIMPLAWWWSPLSYGLADVSGVAVLLLLYKGKGVQRSSPYRLVAWIGLYSYGIYLWHVSVIGPTISVATHLPAVVVPAWHYMATSLAGIAIGVVTTRLIEFPSLKVRDRYFPRRIDSAAGIPAEVEQKFNVETQSESISTL